MAKKRNNKRDQYFVAREDVAVFNVFAYDEFDDDGFYMGHEAEEGYHLDDFDIVAEFDTLEEAVAWADNAEDELYYQ